MSPSRNSAKRHRATTLLFFTFATVSAVGLGAQPPSPQADPVAEEITVSEASLLVDFGSVLTSRPAEQLSSDQLVVLENGESREVLRLEPVLATPRDRWETVLYFDAVMSKPAAIARAAAALGGAAQKLTSLGGVRVVVADPRPTERLATSSAVEVADFLAKLARDPPGEDRSEAARGQQQVDRLLGFLGQGCRASACALWIVSDGYELDDQDTIALADSLSVLEWVTSAVSLQQAQETLEQRQPVSRPADRSLVDSVDRGPYLDGVRIALGRRIRVRSAKPIEDPMIVEPLWDQKLASLLVAARETSGRIVRDQGSLERSVDSLARRLRVWYRTPRRLSGPVDEMDVQLRNGRRLATTRWAAASTPPGVSAARARGLLRGEGLVGDLVLEGARIEGDTLSFRVEWGARSPVVDSSFQVPLRVTLGRRGEAGATDRMEHYSVTLEGAHAAGDDLVVEGIDAAFAANGAVAGSRSLVVEELRFRVFGTTFVD